MYIGHGRPVCVCLSLAAFPHYRTDSDVKLGGNGRRYPLVVHYWANLQSVHGFRYCDNIALNAKCRRVLVLALCLVDRPIGATGQATNELILYPVYTIQPAVKPVIWFDNRLYPVNGVLLFHCTWLHLVPFARHYHLFTTRISCITSTVLRTKVDAQYDKLVTEPS